MPWQAAGARVVAVGGPPGDRVGRAVSVGSLCRLGFLWCVSNCTAKVAVRIGWLSPPGGLAERDEKSDNEQGECDAW